MAELRVLDGQYLLQERTARSGVTATYRAVDIGLERAVAVEMFEPGDGAEAFGERLRDAAGALAAVRSDHVVQVYAFGVLRSGCYVATEFVEGVSLADLVGKHRERGERLPPFRVLTVAAQVAVGLDKVHARGLAHGALGAESIVVERDSGRPVLVGFAFERAVAAPPGSALDPAPDVRGLAVAVHAALGGEGEGPLAPGAPDLAPLDAVFARAFDRSPGAAFRSAGDLSRALEGAWRAVPRAAPASSPAVPPSKKARRADDGALRVLVLHGDEGVGRLVARAAQFALEERVLSVSVAHAEADALASIQRRPPSLFVVGATDASFAATDVLARVRALPGGDEVRVLVVGGRSGVLERWRFAALGARDFLGSPSEMPAIVERIRAIALREGWVKAAR